VKTGKKAKSDAAKAAKSDTSGASALAKGAVGIARFSYSAAGAGQMTLQAGDKVKVEEINPNGWAAVEKLNKITLQAEGEIGWYPACYLHPIPPLI